MEIARQKGSGSPRVIRDLGEPGYNRTMNDVPLVLSMCGGITASRFGCRQMAAAVKPRQSDTGGTTMVASSASKPRDNARMQAPAEYSLQSVISVPPPLASVLA